MLIIISLQNYSLLQTKYRRTKDFLMYTRITVLYMDNYYYYLVTLCPLPSATSIFISCETALSASPSQTQYIMSHIPLHIVQVWISASRLASISERRHLYLKMVSEHEAAPLSHASVDQSIRLHLFYSDRTAVPLPHSSHWAWSILAQVLWLSVFSDPLAK